MRDQSSLQRNRTTLVLACGTFLAAGMILSGLGPILPYLAERSGREVAALGGMFSTLSLGVMAVQALIGWLNARLGMRSTLAVGMAVLAAGALMISWGVTLLWLLVGAGITGVGFGIVLAAGNGLIATLFASRSAAALNGVNVFFGVGSLLGPVVAGVGLQMIGTPQTTLWLGALLLVLLGVGVLAFAAEPPAQAAQAPRESSGVREPRLWLLGVLLLLYTGTEVGLGGWITVFMQTGVGFDLTSAALVTSGFWLALTLGRVTGAVIGVRVRPMMLLLGALLGVAAGALLLVLGGDNSFFAVVAVLVLGFACGPTFPTILALATQGRTGTGIVLGVGNGGGLIIPALLGFVLTNVGTTAMAGLVLGNALLMLALWTLVRRTSQPMQRV
jgi:fucose permease